MSMKKIAEEMGFTVAPHTLGLSDARKMFGYSVKNVADRRLVPGDERLLMNAVLSLNHVADWVWHRWIEGDEQRRQALGITPYWSSFLTWIEKQCPSAKIVRDLANGAKHAKLDAPTTDQDLGMTIIYNQAGWNDDETPLDKQDPIVNFLHEGAIYQRFMREVVSEVVQFWEEFFATTAKDW